MLLLRIRTHIMKLKKDTWEAYTIVSSCRHDKASFFSISAAILSSYVGSGGCTADKEAVSTIGSG
jgi:hypothetical protein